jgi:PPP family 3-phenylpropionic acid transporter
MASILYMDVLAPAGTKTIGQAVNNAVTYGLGLMVGFFISGALFEIMPTGRLFAVSALFPVAGILLFRGLVLARPDA